MTPQERTLIDELFDRLATLENSPRDPEAVAAINEGLRRAPNALYPLVQTVLVQDEALKRADARIRALESELGIEPEQSRQPGFLDNMRDALLGRREPHGSVPSVRPGAPVWGNAPTQPTGQPAVPTGQPQYGPPPGSAGGSFLGTAAATAAGVIGGALLMNSFRGMFGGEHGQRAGAFDPAGTGDAPWGSSGGGDLSRQAGIDDVGRGGRSAAYDDPDASQRAGLFDVAQNDADDSDLDGDLDLDGGDTA